ncbi:tripartite tricarboxylate transporter permease [Oricola sp.]|uniref:tripartite tricarboxylate transporter permease n=1 Tax=Oricola sp. TaxID=1979950 RepID=UPI0025E54DA0|nr:tripartite tricarboxylate transporter permease [Oricola sp.]MCI5074089.1 tripartite tricarboxylate transporter permease [Oricola sp.]
MSSELLTALGAMFLPTTFFFLTLGVFVGIVAGAIPGINGAMVIALSLPLTYFMQPGDALVLLVSMYVGSTTGGLISATLMKMPGTPAAIMTTLDGFPMARRGQAGRALGFGIMSSFVGGLISWVFLATLSPPLAEIAVRFGPFEIFSITLVALMLIAAISQGSMVKGLISGLLGAIAATVGVDPASGGVRLTFGYGEMDAGFRLISVLLGVLVLSQVAEDYRMLHLPVEKIRTSTRDMFMRFADMRAQAWNFLRSSIIGTWIGILPGIGGTTASIAAYTVAKSFSKRSSEFGSGCEDGIVAAESSNNAAVNGALVPLITLGIPGSVVDVMLLGALIIHNLTPGPLLFQNSPEAAYGIIASALVANFVMLAMMLVLTPYIARLIDVPKKWILAPIIVFCIIGAYSEANRFFDVWVMLGFAVVGFLMTRHRIPAGPFIIGFILTPIAEVNLRSGLMISDGSFWPLVNRPISAVFLVFAVITACWPFIQGYMARRRGAREDAANSVR